MRNENLARGVPAWWDFVSCTVPLGLLGCQGGSMIRMGLQGF